MSLRYVEEEPWEADAQVSADGRSDAVFMLRHMGVRGLS